MIPIIGPIIATIGKIGGRWLDKQVVVAEGAIHVAKARAEAEAQVQVSKATAEIEWETQMAKASETSWKDELWTLFFVAILMMSFVPGLEVYVQKGFENIAALPDWFGYAVMLAISAAFGKNIVKDFTSLSTNKKAIEEHTKRKIEK